MVSALLVASGRVGVCPRCAVADPPCPAGSRSQQPFSGVGVEAFKAEIVRAYGSGNPLVESLLRTLVFQTISIDYGVTVASAGGIILVVAGWLRR